MSVPFKNLFFLLILLQTSSAIGQKISNKQMKEVLKTGNVVDINILTEDQFTPEQNQAVDLKVWFKDGSSVLASDYPEIWNKAICKVLNAKWKINKQDTLVKGLIVPDLLSNYLPESKPTIRISIDLAGRNATKILKPNYCIMNYTLSRTGQNGNSGLRPGNAGVRKDGGQGGRGTPGYDGPDMEVQIEEDTVLSKVFLVMIFEGKKYMLDPECSSVQIISQGGNGGKGGQGGSGGGRQRPVENDNGERGGDGGPGGTGGNGGTVTVLGNAVDKYRPKITLMSIGGVGGKGGLPGTGPNGKIIGRAGGQGFNGNAGHEGLVMFISNFEYRSLQSKD